MRRRRLSWYAVATRSHQRPPESYDGIYGGLEHEAVGEGLRDLMRSRNVTYRALPDATRELDGKGMSHSHINMLVNGRDKPSMRAMELVAEACGVDPRYFAEYRLGLGMRELVPAEVGLEQALANLSERLSGRRAAGARRR